MINKQERVLRGLADSTVLLVEPGYWVEERTVHGLYGDRDDLAISLRWRDADGCLWEADFLEQSLMDATIHGNRVVLKDSEGASVAIHAHLLKPRRI
jgi:hypothetical protein